ncbi:hypothetical protein ACFOPN_08415 [Xanthomonas hyacinthi]|uniref:hypothetical protein n=1 Tax=Xanthomonas hyacinthi TaxID=56455 RepID=UPI00361B8E6C
MMRARVAIGLAGEFLSRPMARGHPEPLLQVRLPAPMKQRRQLRAAHPGSPAHSGVSRHKP